MAGNENEEVVVFQVGITGGVEKWKVDLPALFCKVVCDVWRDKEKTRLLFARPQCLDLGEHLGSNTDLGFDRKFVLPPVCIYFDHCVELVAIVVDSLRLLFPADDLRGEARRALEALEGCLDQFYMLGFTFHCRLFQVVHVLPLYMKHERL